MSAATPVTNRITLAYLRSFDEIIDVRSPAEYALDHIPGAINLPVLDNDQRARVGTLHNQPSSFVARRIGAALIARNIADHLLERLADRPYNWRPLIYCWRGGKRSGGMNLILRQIGWKSEQLEGGYKRWRKAVITDLTETLGTFRYRVLCGLTGSGKSRVLQSLQKQGEQVLDLEALAGHRGSLLGDLPDHPQPGQKKFEGLLWWQLQQMDPQRPVYIEAESKRIGSLRVPEPLIQAMWQTGQAIRLDTSDPIRVGLLKQDYQHFLNQPATLLAKLHQLTELHGRQQVDAWCQLATQGVWDELVLQLLHRHYDRSYEKSMLLHYADYPTCPRITLTGNAEPDLQTAAQAIRLL